MENKTRETSDAQQKAFRDHLQRASEIVDGWPDWKKAVIGQGSSEKAPSDATPTPECEKQNNDRGGNGKG